MSAAKPPFRACQTWSWHGTERAKNKKQRTEKSVCLDIYLSVYTSIYLSDYRSVYVSVYLSVGPSVFLSVCRSICLSIHPSTYLSICIPWLGVILWLGPYLYVNLYGILWLGAYLYVNLPGILWLGTSLGLLGFSLGVQADIPKISSHIFETSHNQPFQLIFKENLIL